ncbi:MAG: hypothetical protein CMB64_04835 [Euryarchaeota archaeon]|nr:hypothetical protein [Euryarchaeota archaeon]|tara:strand:- start:1431 stop:1715 length:285 start_codon:yes stop_codon:yes gene_type:complete
MVLSSPVNAVFNTTAFGVKNAFPPQNGNKSFVNSLNYVASDSVRAATGVPTDAVEAKKVNVGVFEQMLNVLPILNFFFNILTFLILIIFLFRKN